MEFTIFGLTLAGIAVFHNRALSVTLAGLIAAILYDVALAPGGVLAGGRALAGHFAGESTVIVNLFLLLLGFQLVSNQFERSGLPEALPSWLPRGWAAPLFLLFAVFLLSTVLDNIAGAVVGGVAARHVYNDRVGTGFIAAIAAAANAGGTGSVIGDTTTTMMWVAGHRPLELAPAFAGATGRLSVSPGSQRFSSTGPVLSFRGRRTHRVSTGKEQPSSS